MRYDKLEYFASQPRLNRFLAACNGSKAKAQKLYRINLRVAQSFYPLLNLFEIFLRNSINYHVSAHFANPNWIMTEKTGFMNSPTLRQSKFFLKTTVQKAENKIASRGIVTSGKVIAEMMFGFWTSLFEPHHYRLIGGVVIHCFANKPANVNRSNIATSLTKIREFRNRVYHNEPVCFNGSVISFQEAIDIKIELYTLFGWIDADLTDYVSYFDSIDEKIAQAQNL
ncbi:Abi family protein [Adhaeribacter swui]|uniref:Abi family protein n=1 Tax=Adhaeribacter swui TaxID=2086471 RepID=A0A7G7GB74_9BACT|nr:Abi family protein [Adhaeribacter swui]QNF34408.1 Abi family protein [Adhaeribacter swui]